jgi:hypothetical protein
MRAMSQRSYGRGSQGDVLALEAQAARAGLALACTYANSAEFDAALIAARRAAGVYGPKRQRRQMLFVVSVAATLTALALSICLFA